MIFKSFLVEKKLSLLDNYPFILFYGENIGLKDEIKFEIKKKYTTFEQINFNQDEINKNERLLDEQIYNSSLFNENKLIFHENEYINIKNFVIDYEDIEIKEISNGLLETYLEYAN